MSKNLSTKLHRAANKITCAVMSYSDIEGKVRIATNDEPWGPSGTQMQELAQYTYTDDGYTDVMGMLWFRMFDECCHNWRKLYKSLILLSYLLRYGSVNVVNNARAQSCKVAWVFDYIFYDEKGKDQSLNVHNKAREILRLMGNNERLREERRRSQASRNNYVGLSYRQARFDRTFAEQRSSDMKDVKPPEIDETMRRNTTAFGVHDNITAQSDEHKVVKTDMVKKSENKIRFSIKKIDLGAAKHFIGSNNPSTPNLTTFETSFGNLHSKSMKNSNSLEDGLRSQSVDNSFNQTFTDSDDLWQPSDAKWTQLKNFESNIMEDANDPFVNLSHRFHDLLTTNFANFNAVLVPQSLGQDGFANTNTIYSGPEIETAVTGAPQFNENAKLLEQNDILKPIFAKTVDDKTKQTSSPAEPEAKVVDVELRNKMPSCVKPNTWSDFKGIDINLDNLKIDCKLKEEKKLDGNIEVFPKQIVPPFMCHQNVMMGQHCMMMTEQCVIPNPSVCTVAPFTTPSFHRNLPNPTNYQGVFFKHS